tara:strand:+ start:306 stop:527 length:222 start_codon:yes stop_codon:yes gene_type:complete
MNIKLDAKAIGGVLSALIISLISWLFRSVQQLSIQIEVLQAKVIASENKIAEMLSIISGVNDNITEIIWKIGG